MGKYSRKDMIEFAIYAKSYQSPKKVSGAYDAYLKGKRHISKKVKIDFDELVKDDRLEIIVGDPAIGYCPNCGKPWNHVECKHCSFDAYCFDPDWD